MVFSDWLLRDPAAGPSGEKTLAYTQDRVTYRDQRAGTLAHTGNPLDIAIGDPGAYFTVKTANGPRLTRAGHFSLSPAGQIIDTAGNPLLDTGGQPLSLNPADTDVTIAADGSVASQNGPIGRIGVVTPQDQTKLVPEGDRLAVAHTPTTATAKPALVQGAIEDSNVVGVSEITQMMHQQREFEFTAQYLQAESDRQNTAIDKLSQRPA